MFLKTRLYLSIIILLCFSMLEEVFSQEILKMSKSKKNVVSPIDIFDKYGADAARMFMLSDTPYEKEFEWTDAGINSVYKYLKKIWSFTGTVTEKKTGKENEEIIKEMHKFLNDYIGCLNRFEFNVAIAKLHEFTNLLGKFNYSDKDNNYTLGIVMKNLAICLSPICPHLSEAMWEQLGHEGLCCEQKLPEINKKYLEETTMQVSVSVNGKFKVCITVDKNLDQESLIKEAKKQNKIINALGNKEVKKTIVVNSKSGKMINFLIARKFTTSILGEK